MATQVLLDNGCEFDNPLAMIGGEPIGSVQLRNWRSWLQSDFEFKRCLMCPPGAICCRREPRSETSQCLRGSAPIARPGFWP